MKGNGMPIDQKEDKSAETMDIDRLIEASSNNMTSELSHAFQVNEGNHINGCTQRRKSESAIDR